MLDVSPQKGRSGIAGYRSCPIQRPNDVRGPVREARIQGRREPTVLVDDRQDADLARIEQLVVQEVHRPYVVGSCRNLTILAELGLDLPLGRLVAQLKI